MKAIRDSRCLLAVLAQQQCFASSWCCTALALLPLLIGNSRTAYIHILAPPFLPYQSPTRPSGGAVIPQICDPTSHFGIRLPVREQTATADRMGHTTVICLGTGDSVAVPAAAAVFSPKDGHSERHCAAFAVESSTSSPLFCPSELKPTLKQHRHDKVGGIALSNRRDNLIVKSHHQSRAR